MPEKEYIEREAALEELNKVPAYFDSGDARWGIEIAMSVVKKQPTADVAKVKHGEWITPTKINGRTFDIPHCSVCENVPCDKGNYCPNCGAKMDGNKKTEAKECE